VSPLGGSGSIAAGALSGAAINAVCGGAGVMIGAGAGGDAGVCVEEGGQAGVGGRGGGLGCGRGAPGCLGGGAGLGSLRRAAIT
jgi:hypothetical protein